MDEPPVVLEAGDGVPAHVAVHADVGLLLVAEGGVHTLFVHLQIPLILEALGAVGADEGPENGNSNQLINF